MLNHRTEPPASGYEAMFPGLAPDRETRPRGAGPDHDDGTSPTIRNIPASGEVFAEMGSNVRQEPITVGWQGNPYLLLMEPH